ncbi:MAG: hypothetical protein B7C24_02885 [Bacteroidetes bacterium 4572_77]|nr:MAG: hypothetical protein B7C24_02885 [Bacteroidetes bacterium 4572_77]
MNQADLKLQKQNEQLRLDLIQQNERFQQVVINSDSWLLEMDLKWVCTFSKGNTNMLFKVPAPEMLGKTIAQLFSPENTTQLKKEIASASFTKKESFTTEIYDVSEQGNPICFQLNISAVFVEQKMRAYRFVGIDISGSKKSNIIVRENQERLRAFSAVVEEAVFFSDKGICVEANEAATRLFGYDYKEMVGMLGTAFIAPESYELVKSNMMSGYDKPYDAIGLRKDGSTFDGEFYGSMFHYKGKSIRVTSVRDITQRKVAERRLVESEKRFAGIMNNTSSVIYVKDVEGKYLFVNQSFEKLFQVKNKDIVGQKETFLFSQEVAGLYRENDKSVVFENEMKEFVEEVLVDGKVHTFDSLKFPLHDSFGKIYAVCGMSTDVTRWKQQQEELQAARKMAMDADKAKSTFLSNMSHEIRTPMNGVIGMTALLLETKLSNEQYEFVDTVKKSGESLLSIINDILDFSKIEAGKMELEEAAFDLQICIEETLDLLATKANEKNLDLSYYVDPKIETLIVGDITRLRQVLVNLVSNAIKFTHSGGVFVKAVPHSVDGDKMKLKITVSDTGIGISLEKQKILFKAFTQADLGTSKKYGGTGLGLSICLRLVKMMNGKIWVESRPDEGADFVFIFETSKSSIKTTNYYSTNDKIFENKKVLIVDDNKINRRILSIQCQGWGMKTTAVESGIEALELIKNKEVFNLGIIDYQMPQMDGLNLSISMTEFLGDKKFPLIMLSSMSLSSDNLKNNKNLFVKSLLKPAKINQLYDAISLAFNIKTKVKVATPDKLIISDLGLKYPLQILVAEDNYVNQKIAVSVLKKMGFKPHVVANGLEAIKIVDKKKIDIILMDMMMPEMDGVDATIEIIKRHGAKSPIIIAMTAAALQEDQQKCFNAGMKDFISKPFRIKDLQELLIRWGEVIMP